MQEALTNGSHSVGAQHKSSPPPNLLSSGSKQQMATSLPRFLSLALILCYVGSTMAAVHIVGDQLGWRPLVNYYSWVRSRSIKLGDTLVFNYNATKGYSVAEVTQFKFIACNGSNAIFFDNSGSSSVHLLKPGQHYFMDPNHCLHGEMVFSVLV